MVTQRGQIAAHKPSERPPTTQIAGRLSVPRPAVHTIKWSKANCPTKETMGAGNDGFFGKVDELRAPCFRIRLILS